MTAKATPEQLQAAADAFNAFNAQLEEHDDCPWEQVGPCVYCTAHNVRLYQGELAAAKRTTPICADGEHDWDADTGQGFYYQCRTCRYTEWTE